jgi:hypothetical protein
MPTARNTPVPSIDRRPPLTISFRRAEVVGFWILGLAVLSLSIGLAAAGVGAQVPWAWGVGAAAALILPGVVWRPWFEAGVWVWNGSVHRAAAALRTCLLVVCYYILFLAVGRSISSLDPAGHERGSSGWLVRNRNAPHWGDAIPSVTDSRAGDRLLGSFVRIPGNRWAITLFPFVFFLRLLRDEQQENVVPSSTYTLY